MALLEFIPYEWIKGDSRNKDVGEEVGIDRFGTNSLIDGFGAMLFIALAILLTCFLLFIIRCLASKYSKIMFVYRYLIQRMRYSALIRYVL